MVNLNKLNAAFVEKQKRKSEVARKMGISVQALGKKLSGKTKITCDDAEALIEALNVTDYQEKVDIFLTTPSQ